MSANMENTVEQIKKIIGEPRNYGEHRDLTNYVECGICDIVTQLNRPDT